ncbi:hypothetical protein [Streptomyces sp. CBMAI 2042]|uniref:hypothetical protein n=1 Tax=Streptomyces sp. CBMAI 2042 TaxID=2305222 RepID=UPI001F43B9AD|nr:hypothetical protein [Streptomyces sp. CBMAI 2042]
MAETEWVAGEVPWARQGTEHLPCYFCGRTAILGSGDRPDDPGRLEVYCGNPMCDAREMVVLVKRDGAGAPDRADVRALREVDRPRETPAALDIMARYEDTKNITARRLSTTSLAVVVEAHEGK